jgi:prepilin-type N-terminal cleavage/methylation domain-containing protein/prepilin-type processing-associated H-X9-DG protein
MSSHSRAAFTLVELLVVITIIGILMGLLLPAVLGSRRTARLVTCINNQRELALAIHQYDLTKQHLPGYVNSVGGNVVGWAPVLLPFIGRQDLWEGGWRTPTPALSDAAGRIAGFVCPEDLGSATDARLTYVVSVGLYSVPAAPWPTTTPGVFQDYSGGAGNAITLSDIRAPGRTVMLSEKLDPTRYWSQLWTPALWTPAVSQAAAPYFGFGWPDPAAPALATSMVGSAGTLPAPLLAPVANAGPLHAGVVVVTFCDGHVEKVPEDTLCREYSGAP